MVARMHYKLRIIIIIIISIINDKVELCLYEQFDVVSIMVYATVIKT